MRSPGQTTSRFQSKGLEARIFLSADPIANDVFDEASASSPELIAEEVVVEAAFLTSGAADQLEDIFGGLAGCRYRFGKLTVAVLVAFSLFILADCAWAQVEFQKREGELEIFIGGRPFATYVWNDPVTSRPYFKQIKVSSGIQVTRHHPPRQEDISDHETYHPGLWWGFGDVGGHDYWRLKAKVVGGEFVSEPKGGNTRGMFEVRNRLLTTDEAETFCWQTSRYTILPRKDGVMLLCETELWREEEDYWLGDQEEMGLAVRLASPIALASANGGRVIDAEGRTDLEQIRTNQSNWCDYSGPIEGKYAGIMIMNDPSNFRRPWWHVVDTGLMVANPLGESELKGRGKRRENVLIRKGERFRLRYGVFFHCHDREQQFDPEVIYDEFLMVIRRIDSKK